MRIRFISYYSACDTNQECKRYSALSMIGLLCSGSQEPMRVHRHETTFAFLEAVPTDFVQYCIYVLGLALSLSPALQSTFDKGICHRF